MSATEKRLAKLERLAAPSESLEPVMLIAADDPEAERLIAEHEDKPGTTLIVLTGVHRSPEGLIA
jgi:hypothetical protein